MIRVAEVIGVIDEVQSGGGSELLIALLPGTLGQTPAPVIPAIVARGRVISHPATIGQIGDHARVVGVSIGAILVISGRPRVHETLCRVIEIFHHLQPGPAFMRELRHCVRDGQGCGQAVLGEDGRGTGDNALNQSWDMLIPVRPAVLHHIEVEVGHATIIAPNSPEIESLLFRQ